MKYFSGAAMLAEARGTAEQQASAPLSSCSVAYGGPSSGTGFGGASLLALTPARCAAWHGRRRLIRRHDRLAGQFGGAAVARIIDHEYLRHRRVV